MDESGVGEYELISPVLATDRILKRHFIWQMRFLTKEKLCRHAKERGLSFSELDHTVQHLWQLALLRADYVSSRSPLTIEGLTLAYEDQSGNYVYADQRVCAQKTEGFGGATRGLPDLSMGIQLRFHPFRYYVLCKIEELLQIRIGITYLLNNPEGLVQAVNFIIQSFNRRTSKRQFGHEVCRWNEIVSLAVSAEPFTYNRLFGVYKVPAFGDGSDEARFYQEMKNQYADCKNILEKIGGDKTKQVISDLCLHAKSLDPNTDVHHLLRFTGNRYRIESVKGRLGGAILLLTMAETIRRAAEMAFDIQFPEEDEFVSGGDARSLKTHLYGTPRLNDNYKAKEAFIHHLGLDYNVRLRWYVEGATELGALFYLLEGYTKIDIVNLKGDVIAKQGKGLSFRETLLNDIERSVYSWISLDGDLTDNVRLVKKAAMDGEMFGQFFISNPDFEIHNFSVEELAEIFWEMALVNAPHLSQEDRERLFLETASVKSAKAFFDAAKRALPAEVKMDKGKEWGERLGKYAESNPFKPKPDGTKAYRPIIYAIKRARHIIQCDYYRSQRDYRVCPKNGEMIERVSISAT